MCFAYGVLGMSVEELAGFTLYNFDLKCEGYKQKENKEESWFRNVALFSVAPHVESSGSLASLWRIGDEKDEPLISKKDMKRRLATYWKEKEKRLAKLIN